MKEYLLSIYRAQQYPNSTLSKYCRKLFKHAQDHLISHPRFAVCFHNLFKSLWDDKNNHQLIRKIIKQHDKQIISALANTDNTYDLKILNLCNWLTDCLKFIANTHHNKDNEIIFTFYLKLFEQLIATKAEDFSLSIQNLAYLQQINQFALGFISNNQPDSTLYKIANQVSSFLLPFFKNSNQLASNTLENCLIAIPKDIGNLKFIQEFSKAEFKELKLYSKTPFFLGQKIKSIFDVVLPSLIKNHSLINDEINFSPESSSANKVLHNIYNKALKYLKQSYKYLIRVGPSAFIDFFIHDL